jgi:hypothetical protein
MRVTPELKWRRGAGRWNNGGSPKGDNKWRKYLLRVVNGRHKDTLRAKALKLTMDEWLKRF